MRIPATLVLATLALLGCATQRLDTPPPTDPLYREIARMDEELSAAFNTHDVTRLMSLFTPDLEFYHDQHGLQSYAETQEGFTSLLSTDNGMRRDLVKGTLEVYPLKGFGAVEIGAHRFCHREDGRAVCGTFRFLQVWKRQEHAWKISRVVSYGH